jgi:predicted enzyme related to lactoylglutathione lyase
LACYHLATPETATATAFYSRLFGWTARDIRVAGSLGAVTFRSGDVVAATAGPADSPDGVSAWLPCLAVADVVAVAAECERLGGRLRRSPSLPGADPFMLYDAVGAPLCLAAPTACGQGVEAAAPGRFCWAELATPEPERAAVFYASLAGWSSVDRPRGGGARYWVFRHGLRDVAGMVHETAAGQPSRWVPYVQVVSAEDTSELARDLGGFLVTPPGDVPGRGRFAVLRDPVGALVAVFALTDAA